MANIKVSEMTEATTFDDGDYTMIVQANQNKKISKENILGDIEGDISTINTNIGELSNLATDDKTSIVNSINELKEREIYSTDEVKTNKIWTDGKPIYRKVKEFFLTATGATSYSISDLNIDTLIDYNPLTIRSGSSVSTDIEKPYFYNISTDMCRVFIRDNSTIEVRYQIGSLYTSTKVRCVLEYTKTTD